jgi:hypothetical protein
MGRAKNPHQRDLRAFFMALPISSAQYTAIAKELLASSANMLAADRRSYAAIEDAYEGSGTDTYGHFTGIADALDALATSLRS